MTVNRILHRAGNATPGSLASLVVLAGHLAVDAIEADVWVHGDDLLAHHERPLGPLPLLLGWGGFQRRSSVLSLHAILEARAGHADVVVDLRSWFGDPAPELARALADEATRSRVCVTCEDWSIADRVRAWLPGIRIGYSIRTEAQLRAYLVQRDAGVLSETAVAIRHTLLHTPDEVALLRERARRVNAWTVDDVDRAMQLVSWGVDEITSNHVTVLNAL